MKKALMDAWYMFGLWVIGRLSEQNMADMLEKWAKAIRRKYNEDM